MTRWAPNLYLGVGQRKGISKTILTSALAQAHKLQNAGLPAVLTLNHLSFHTNVAYIILRKVVEREHDPYRTFQIRKRSGGKRIINIPDNEIMIAQKWIDKFILSKIQPSPYSYAFHKNNSIIDCAKQHLRCRWLIKLDLRNFFESLSEIQVYNVFYSAGYGNLVSFEFGRLCTKILDKNAKKYKSKRWTSKKVYSIDEYSDSRIGHLPQGAPTSPKLANIILKKLDEEIADLAYSQNLVYTRYADDISLSTSNSDFNRSRALDIVRKIYKILPKYGLRPNPQKAQIIPPGGRKTILGLLVDSDQIRLSKTFRSKLECHLYYSSKNPVYHASDRGFHSVIGLKNYINGLLAYAKQIDPEYTTNIMLKYGTPNWGI